MQGIATIDRQAGSHTIAVWVTKRTEPLRADNTNAVVIDAASDPHAMAKVHSLTRGRAILVTDGSVVDDLPIDGKPATMADIDDLVIATQSHRQAIVDAVRAYKKRTRSASVKEPTFSVIPTPADFAPADDTATQRALNAANFAGRVWTAWLRTDEERRRRTVRPKTGESPWMMPEALNSQEIAPIPDALVDRFREQPLS